jgi:methyl-accepting chemotaxis protein
MVIYTLYRIDRINPINNSRSAEIDINTELPQIRQILITQLIVVIGISVGSEIVIVNHISKKIKTAKETLHFISTGNLDIDLSHLSQQAKFLQRDELDELQNELESLISNYLHPLADTAKQISSGDLMTQFAPVSEKDELGIAFTRIIETFQDLVSQTAKNSDVLRNDSVQLANFSEQTNQATQQIATTVQQIAQGATSQAEALSETANAMDKMSRDIDDVTKGADEQAKEIQNVSLIVRNMSQAIEQVLECANEGLKGFDVIQEKVSSASEKVVDMGTRSKQISSITATIEEIADQTNLLALNAAIEAARAGEQGRGFAVVADEVRKLADRSSHAAKEIASLLSNIHETVEQAVHAMDDSVNEVKNGDKKMDDINSAALQMKELSSNLNTSMDKVSAVVVENTTATKEMAANSLEISRSFENIASVSEENSAATEEVSASVEEMSSQIDEISNSAKSLSEMVESLQTIINQFKFAHSQSPIA